jgi:hypothetical protein
MVAERTLAERLKTAEDEIGRFRTFMQKFTGSPVHPDRWPNLPYGGGQTPSQATSSLTFEPSDQVAGNLDVKEGGVAKSTANVLDFLGADFDVTESPVGTAQIVIASAIARDSELPHNLDDTTNHADTNIGTAADGEMLTFDGSKWIDKEIPLGGTIFVVASSGNGARQASIDGTIAAYQCDGTDDDAQIQQAINDVGANGRVLLSEGTFVVAGNSIAIDSSVHLQGMGIGATTIKLKDGAGNDTSRIISQAGAESDITISDMTFDGNETNNNDDSTDPDPGRDGHSAVFISSVTGLTIERVEFIETYSGAALRLGGCVNVRISDCVFANNKDTSGGSAFSCDSIFCGDGQNIQIINCVIGVCSDTGIALDGSGYVAISNNVIRGAATQSISVVDSPSGISDTVTITGNIIGTVGGGGYGVRCFANNATTSVNIVISGNNFTACDHGVSIETDIDGIVVSSNIFECNSGATKDAIRFVGTPDDILIIGNHMISGTLIGINYFSTPSPTNVFIFNNNLTDATAAVSGTVAGTRFFNNPGYAVHQLNSENLTNVNSLFLDEQAAADGSVVGDGQFWVKNDAPNIAKFTDDDGTDFSLAHNATTTLSSLTTVGALGSGSLAAGFTDVPIAQGGTGQSTQQAAIDALTAVSGATNEHVLTKDTGTGNATFKAAAGGGDLATDTLWAATGDLVKGTGDDTADILSIGGANSVLAVSGGTAAWVDTPTLETLTLAQNDGGSEVMMTISPTTTGVTNWQGMQFNTTLTLSGNNRTATGVFAQMGVRGPSAGTGEKIHGLNFIAIGQAIAVTTTFAEQGAILAFSRGFAASGTINITDQWGLKVSNDWVDSSGTLNIGDLYGLWVPSPSLTLGTPDSVDNYYGLKIETFATATANYLMWAERSAGNASLRLDAGNPPDSASATLGDSNLHLAWMENGSVNLRQIRWEDSGAGGGAGISANRKLLYAV